MAGSPAKIGILALQGAVDPHQRHLERLGVQVIRVRIPEQLTSLSGIILPGGESSAMIHLLRLNHLWEPLRLFAQQKPVLGVCAGAILLAKNVTGPEQDSLQALDIDVARNAYGRQVDSFSALLTPVKDSPFEAIEGIFIRAPRISRVGTGVKTLLQHQGEPVLVEQGKVLAGTFHPELTDSLAVHHYFTTKCESESAAWTTDSQKSYELSSIN